MAGPIRVQRKRTKGFRLPENTQCVTRPGPWGNPFETASEFAEAFELCLEWKSIPPWMDPEKGLRILWMIHHIDELAGLNLACFCSLEKSCHADYLLAYANASSDFLHTNGRR